jgi:hypothetical protein
VPASAALGALSKSDFSDMEVRHRGDPSVTMITPPGSIVCCPSLSTTSQVAVAADRQAVRSVARITSEARPSDAVAGGTQAVAA